MWSPAACDLFVMMLTFLDKPRCYHSLYQQADSQCISYSSCYSANTWQKQLCQEEKFMAHAQSSLLEKVWRSGSVHITWLEVEGRHARARWFSPLPFLLHLPHPRLWAHATYSHSGFPLSVNPLWRWLHQGHIQRCDQSPVKVTMKFNHCQQP